MIAEALRGKDTTAGGWTWNKFDERDIAACRGGGRGGGQRSYSGSEVRLSSLVGVRIYASNCSSLMQVSSSSAAHDPRCVPSCSSDWRLQSDAVSLCSDDRRRSSCSARQLLRCWPSTYHRPTVLPPPAAAAPQLWLRRTRQEPSSASSPADAAARLRGDGPMKEEVRQLANLWEATSDCELSSPSKEPQIVAESVDEHLRLAGFSPTSAISRNGEL
mmetsp:Transcript_1911/g.5590  ORF Transcript_1911/g.5590 Transcript_1911/m.5590 type:complete len:217 (+) Transcript_1911:908-1558(+)